MKNPQVKQRIKITRPGCGYQTDKTYVVVKVDPNDSTLVASDSRGTEGSWINWNHCVPAGDDINWSWLKGQMPAEALELLSGFDGLESLRLKDEIRDRILLQLPNLKERILSCQIQIEEEADATERLPHAAQDPEEDLTAAPF